MENYYVITDNSHNKIYQTYAELKKKLPPNFLKMKVISSPKYSINKKPLLKKIENDKLNLIKKVENPLDKNKFINKNIYILNDETIKLKKAINLKPIIFHEQKYDENLKKTLLTEKDKITDYMIEQNQNNLNEFLQNSPDDYQGYNFHSNPITDVHMKSNIYLPKIIDRMKYNIPRNERDKNGFHVDGIGIFSSNKIKYDEKNDNYEININSNNKKNNLEYEDYLKNIYIK